MSDEYLWDGSGEPDAEAERLEKLLGRFRSEPRPVEFPAAATSHRVPGRRGSDGGA